MTMKKINMTELKKIAQKYRLQPFKVKGTEVVSIKKRTSPSERFDIIDWSEFEKIIKKRGLAVYKATESDFLKIMKKKS